MASAKIEGLEGKKVLVTGAGGRTGSSVFRKLQAKTGFSPVGLVRTRASAEKLRRSTGATDQQIVIGDILDRAVVKKAVQDSEAVILCTSAVPKPNLLSILWVLALKLLRKSARPQFTWKGGEPSVVDYEGAMNQIEAAKEAGVKHFVFLGSMGGTQPDNFLNTLGRRKDGSGGNILVWKRKAERELVKSGLTYTIVHPGGLLDKPGGELRLVLDVDDRLLERKTRSISREDVAEVLVESLLQPAARNKAFDIVSEEGPATSNFKALFEGLGKASCTYEND